jgi:ectoine hydroxylase-related dioxygenase (phytanoyl-CoA dioxygenase family)
MNTTLLRAITAEEIAAYQRDGVVCLKGMFDADWCARMYDASVAFMVGGGGRNREVRPADGSKRMFQSVWMSDINDDFRAFREASAAPEIAATLMQVDEVRFFYDQLFIKEPGSTAPTPWHNDLPFWPFRGSHLISLWTAFTPVKREWSGVEYVAGSHRWNKFFRAITPDRDPHFENPALEVCPDYGASTHAGLQRLSWDMQPGDVLVHHPLTVHGAGGNQNQSQRRVGLSVRYFGRDVQWDPRPHTMRLPRTPQVAPGEYPGDDAAFPLMWNRARGLVAARSLA